MTIEVFDVFECELLRDYPGGNLRAGRIVYGSRLPNDCIYLSASGKAGSHHGASYQGPVFEADAQMGVDFKASPEVEAALNEGSAFESAPFVGARKRAY